MVPAEAGEEREVARVIPLLKVRRLGDRRFDYSVPPELASVATVGSVVSVPFGPRMARAVVVEREPLGHAESSELRPILSVEPQSVPPDLMRLAAKLADRYLAPHEACLRLVAPPLPRSGAIPQTGLAGAWIGPMAAPGILLTEKQARVVAAIPSGGCRAQRACEAAGVTVAVARTLLRKGAIETRPAPAGEPLAETRLGTSEAEAPRLSLEQTRVVKELTAALRGGRLTQRQLWGVTGSGKTEVYLRLIGLVLNAGGSAILLVPEIALTPQTIQRVQGRFGDRVGVLHSGLTPAARAREYARIAKGEAKVVVGARSAVFAPVSDLRLIVIDESHDASYKQEEGPRYHARVAAELRLEERGGLLLEGSATPALEAMTDQERCLRLTDRASGAPPEWTVVDMRRQGSARILAPVSRAALVEVLRRHEQAIVLLNRRGASSFVHCEDCGHVLMCEDCELSLTYHSGARRLLCHHCGRTYAQPSLCPQCGLSPLVRGAPGTERLFDELQGMAPSQNVFRLDSDVLTSGARARAVLDGFLATRPSVLVGTQMVAKGHDFADVTLVVVADADTGLYVPDFRAAERTFQLLIQVAGRAGRADKPGRVLVQTWNPDVPCIRMAIDRDEEGFYRWELNVRRRLGYPPFTQLVRILTVGEDAERARLGASHLAERLSPHFVAGELRGPARLPALRGKSRWHLLVAAEDGARARAIVGQAMAQLIEPYRRRGVALLVDVDPMSFN